MAPKNLDLDSRVDSTTGSGSVFSASTYVPSKERSNSDVTYIPIKKDALNVLKKDPIISVKKDLSPGVGPGPPPAVNSIRPPLGPNSVKRVGLGAGKNSGEHNG